MPSETAKASLGYVTSYGAARRGGYQGTYEEWCALMAEVADHLEENIQLNEDSQAAKAAAETAELEAEAAALTAESWAKGTKGGTDVPSTDPAYHDNAKYYAGEAEDQKDLAEQAASAAVGSAETAEGHSTDAEAWAAGTRGGEDVESGDDAYHNNAKYYSEQSSGFADDAAGSASDAEAWAKGTKNGTDVPSTDPTYHNNAKYWSEQAEETAEDIEASSAQIAQNASDIGDLKTQLKADELSNNNIVIYDGIRTLAGSSSWPTRTFTKNLIKINGSFSANADNYYTRMDGPGAYSTTMSGVNGWAKNIPLVAEHTYKFTGMLLSGSVTIPDGETLTYNAKDSDNNIVLTCGYNESVIFTCETTGNFLFYFHAQKNTAFTEAILAYTLVDVTDITVLQEEVAELNDAVPINRQNIAALADNNIINTLKNFSVNVFSKYATDYITGKGYSGSTGTIVDAVNNLITGYIPVIAGDGVQCFVNGKNITLESVEGQTRKIAIYDAEKTWKKTETVNGMGIEYYPITENGFVRFMLRRTDYIEVFVSSLTKKDSLVDLIVFAGQSNMAGRGETSTTYPEAAPAVIPGAGYEFKSITDPTKLYPITEPFGVSENNPGGGNAGIDDGNSKTGDMVPAFVNAYYTHNGYVPVVGVSASEGGSSSVEWLPETGNNFVDLAARIDTARKWLVDNGYSIRHQYCVWCQGESDGDNIYNGTETLAQYETRARAIFSGLIALGLEKVLLVRIGNYNGTATGKSYTAIIDWQTEEAQTNDALVMVSCDFAKMKSSGMMKDDFHYYQIGYNIAGNSAGINSAFYATTGKDPIIFDPENDELYYSHKN